jgi:hypothetical protein
MVNIKVKSNRVQKKINTKIQGANNWFLKIVVKMEYLKNFKRRNNKKIRIDLKQIKKD